MEPRSTTQEAIEQVEAAYDQAWGAGDINGILDCLTEDAVVVTPRGDVARGHAQIRALLEAFLAGEARRSTHESALVRIEVLTDTVVLVDGEARIAKRAPASAEVVRHGFTDVLVERGGRWRIAHVRAYALPQVVPAPAARGGGTSS